MTSDKSLSLSDLGKALAAQCQLPLHLQPEHLERWSRFSLKKRRMAKKFHGSRCQRMVPGWVMAGVKFSRRRNEAQEKLFTDGFAGFLDPRQPLSPNGGIWIKINSDGSRDIFRVTYDGEVMRVEEGDHVRDVNEWLRGVSLQPIDRRISEAVFLHERHRRRRLARRKEAGNHHPQDFPSISQTKNHKAQENLQ